MAKNYPNRIVTNVKSPKNESAYIAAYKELNPKSNRRDGKDISAVRTSSGEYGHALLPKDKNRSRDRDPHRGEDFISNSELRKKMKK